MDQGIHRQWAPFRYLNELELPLIKFLQKLFKAEKYMKYHVMYQDILSTRILSFYPLILYAMNYKDTADLFAKRLIIYSLISAAAKLCLPRFRPMHYRGVAAESKFYSSSLPSRHTIASYVFATTLFPPSLKYIFILSMMINRVICGAHFITDCLAGVFFGYLTIIFTEYVKYPWQFYVIGLTAVYCWANGTRIVGCALPMIMRYPHCAYTPVLIYVALGYLGLSVFRKRTRLPRKYMLLSEYLIMSFLAGLVDYVCDSMICTTSQDISVYLPRFV